MSWVDGIILSSIVIELSDSGAKFSVTIKYEINESGYNYFILQVPDAGLGNIMSTVCSNGFRVTWLLPERKNKKKDKKCCFYSLS